MFIGNFQCKLSIGIGNGTNVGSIYNQICKHQFVFAFLINDCPADFPKRDILGIDERAINKKNTDCSKKNSSFHMHRFILLIMSSRLALFYWSVFSKDLVGMAIS